MLLKRSKILFVVSSILVFSSCRGHGPLVDVCVGDPVNQGGQCMSKKQKPYFKPFAEMENWVCLPPDDAIALIQACRKGK